MSDSQVKPKATFCTNIQLPPGVHDFEEEGNKGKPAEMPLSLKRLIYMDDRVVPGSFYVEAVWATAPEPTVHPVHRHDDHDEILGFVSSNVDDPTDLDAEIDLVVDGVKTTITKTCFVHVPAGVEHGGLCFRKINRPVFQIAMSRQPRFESVPPT